MSPGYFMQSHERLADPLVTSATRRAPKMQEWLQKITSVQQLLTDVLQVVHPSLHDVRSQTPCNQTPTSRTQLPAGQL
ncbi:hypothetical protein PAXRUDRAFT_20180 [Paxillus rubicundulus Ve08.2h10]|uniref:Uncharacterized protein n=1 Tax=Paxillus rubicundulus Ve08.2h10 TaxID=930991 RepID=A0A0D0BRK7_9AGAM|nr:hypothetical protein PAXRUDRAFT_20180 [Paxillus rubicundulus Ve08.2h10]